MQCILASVVDSGYACRYPESRFKRTQQQTQARESRWRTVPASTLSIEFRLRLQYLGLGALHKVSALSWNDTTFRNFARGRMQSILRSIID
jgi:hypothetical protein